MKKKSKKLIQFLEGLHDFIVTNPLLRKNTFGKSEIQIQAEIRSLILLYLEEYFRKSGYKDYRKKAYQSFYWEGQEGEFGKQGLQHLEREITLILS